MRIIDDVNLEIGLGSEDSHETVGIVFKTEEEMGGPYLGVIIPKYMVGYEFKSSDKATEKSVSVGSKKCINSSDIEKFIDSKVTIKNYIIVRPLLNQNQSMPTYNIGDKIIVKMIDNDIKTLTFLPYSINRLGQRATDKLFLSVPANPNDNLELTEDNTYYLKIDSKNQIIEMTTNKENGEVCKQTFKLDSKEGIGSITDGERLIEMDTKNDKISTITTGSKIVQTCDVIDMEGDVLNINMDTSVNIKTDKYNLEADTVSNKATDAKCDYDNFEQNSQSGKYNIRTESHDGTIIGFKGMTFHVDVPTIGLNGQVVFPSFHIGNIPNINIPTIPLSGTSGPMGTMIMQTDVAGMPLVKFPQLMAVISALAAAVDAKVPPTPGVVSGTVAGLMPLTMTNKIFAS